jgi:hypothetical protein
LGAAGLPCPGAPPLAALCRRPALPRVGGCEFTFDVYLQCWHEFYILSIGTNPRGITSSLVHVGFGV